MNDSQTAHAHCDSQLVDGLRASDRTQTEETLPLGERSFRARLTAARDGSGLEYGDPGLFGEQGRRRRLARVLIWAAEGHLAESIAADAAGGDSGATFALLRMSDSPRLSSLRRTSDRRSSNRQWARWRSRAEEVFEEHLACGRDHFQLDCLAVALDVPRRGWPSPARLALAAGLTLPSARAHRVRAQALLHAGQWELAARRLSGLLGSQASPADRLTGCLGWARLHSSAQRTGPARHALRAAVRRAPLSPEVWRLARDLAADLGDQVTRDQLARGARVVRRLERSREPRSKVGSGADASGSPAPPAGSLPGTGSRYGSSRASDLALSAGGRA